METQAVSLESTDSRELPRWMSTALAGFDVDSRMARRSLRVSVAVKVFGVGTLLDNNLPDLQTRHPQQKRGKPRKG